MPGYTYETRDLVYKFNGPDGQLSNGMKAIFDSIKAIAIDDLTEEKFREFYEQNFIMGDFTDIKEGEKKSAFCMLHFIITQMINRNIQQKLSRLLQNKNDK